MTERLLELVYRHFWFNTGPVVFVWGTAVVREGMVRFLIGILAFCLCLWIAAAAIWTARSWMKRL